ncbi:hypothetical protein RVV74_002961 [Enterobacter ludwigii]|nr:hypothetical protein [Enterobacter ludwigii]
MMRIAFKYILMFLYYSSAFFALSLIIRIVMGLIHSNNLFLTLNGITSGFIKSLIAGAAITIAAIIFNLTDKYRTRKPPSE